MNYNLEIRLDAPTDIAEAAKWYEARESGLGREFVSAVTHTIDTLASNPLAHRLRNRCRNIRWVLISVTSYKSPDKSFGVYDSYKGTLAREQTCRREL